MTKSINRFENDPRIDAMVLEAGNIRELVQNVVLLAGQLLDAGRDKCDVIPELDLSGMAPNQRFMMWATDAGGFDTDPEVVKYGNYFYFSILGHAYDLYVALPSLTDAELTKKASEVVAAMCAIPEAYVPVFPESAEVDEAFAPEGDIGDLEFLRQGCASALIYVSGWCKNLINGNGESDLIEDPASLLVEDPGWEPRQGGMCNCVTG